MFTSSQAIGVLNSSDLKLDCLWIIGIRVSNLLLIVFEMPGLEPCGAGMSEGFSGSGSLLCVKDRTLHMLSFCKEQVSLEI